MPTAIKLMVSAALSAVAFSTISAETSKLQSNPVVTVVRVPVPWYAPKMLVTSKMRDSIPEYEKIPGLTYKIYTLSQDKKVFGGIYLWTDRNSAMNRFNAAWFARVEKERGAPGEVRTFDASNIVDHTPGGTPLEPKSSSVVAMLTLPTTDNNTERAAQLRTTLAMHPNGLLREVSISSKALIGLVLLWRDEASAKAGLDDVWRGRARQTLGAEPSIEWYEAPVLLPTMLKSNALSAR